MSTVVFDIETIGQFNELDEEGQAYILKTPKRWRAARSETQTSLWPFSGQMSLYLFQSGHWQRQSLFQGGRRPRLEDFSDNGADFYIWLEKEIFGKIFGAMLKLSSL